MNHILILACDVGSSGVKTTLVKSDGTVFASKTVSYPTFSSQPGWSEQNPEHWWEGFCKSAKFLFEKYPEAASQVSAIGVSGHMIGCLPVNDKGEPLCNAMIHSDMRSVKQSARVEALIGKRKVYEITGNILEPRSPVCKILWLKENREDIYNKTYRFLQSKDYISGKLTGNFDTTDYSDASHGQIINITTKKYAEFLPELGIDISKLPQIYKGIDKAGNLTDEAAAILGLKAGIPVAVGAGDGPCANIGAGVVMPGEIYACIGTTAWIASVNTQPVFDVENRLFNYTSADGENCCVVGTVQAAGKSVQWIADLFKEKDYKKFDQMVETVEPGSNGLVFLPYLEGERSPVFDSKAKSIFYGLNPLHRKQHFMRATMEGVSMALRQIADVFRENMEVNEIRVIGGGAKSMTWKKMLASIGQFDVLDINASSEDGTSLGSAIIGGVAAGIFTSIKDGVKSIKTVGRVSFDADEGKKYENAYKTYVKLYPALKPVFHDEN